MALELVQGQAKILNRDVETHGYVSGSGGRVHGQMSSMRTVTLEVGNQIVNIKHKEPIVVTDGDYIVAVGVRKSNGVQSSCVANRNRSTRNDPPDMLAIICGVLLIVLGLPLCLFLIGIPFVALGGFALYMGLQMRKAKAMLDEALSRPMPVGMG